MGLDVRLSIDIKVLAGKLEQRREQLRDVSRDALATSRRELLGEIRRQLRGTSVIGLGDNQPSAWRELGPVIDVTETEMAAELGSSHPRATFHETGGTIVPGKSKARGGPRKGQTTRALTIPVGAARTKLGTARAGRVATGGGISQFGPLKVRFFGKKGARVFGALDRRGGDTIALLARKVTQEARPYMAPALKKTKPVIAEIYREKLRKVTA